MDDPGGICRWEWGGGVGGHCWRRQRTAKPKSLLLLVAREKVRAAK